ncbi:PAS domain S-box protein [Myxococcota bacterium]|nr:PAS domain S-box protein [Myxococcota bacterium]
MTGPGSKPAETAAAGPGLLPRVVDALVTTDATAEQCLVLALAELAQATGHHGAALVLPDDGQAGPPLRWGRQDGAVQAVPCRRRGQLRGVLELRGAVTPVDSDGDLTLAACLLVQAAHALHLERRLEDERTRLALLSDAAWEGLLLHDGARVLDANQALASLVGRSRAELLAGSIWDLAAPEEAANILERIRSGFQGRYHTLVVHRTGERIPVEMQVRQVEGVGGGPVRLVAMRDMRAAMQAERALREAEERTRALLETTYDGVAVTRVADGRVVEANDGFARLFGRTREECIGLSPADVLPAEDARTVAHHVAAGRTQAYQVEGRHRDGRRFPLQVLGRPATWNGEAVRITGFRDVSAEHQQQAEHQALLAQLHHAQKLESLGVMAGGMAHDFNNLLGIIQGHGELAALACREDRDPSAFLARVLEATSRAAELTGKLLAYTGRDAYDLRPLDLGRLVQDAAGLLRAPVEKRAGTLQLDLPPAPVLVSGEASGLRQVVLSLVTNAAEALPEAGGPVCVRLRLLHAAPSDEESPGYPAEPLPAGPCAVLEVVDPGVGIDPGVKTRIFDPFFTTKFAGRGLGLPAAQGIVRGHGGTIRVHSTPGLGSTFQVFLPACAVSPPLAPPIPAPASAPGLRPVVLVADDEPGLREIVRLMLGRMGLDCRVAADGDEAVRLFEAERHPFALAILDITMPGRSGIEVLAHVRAQAPVMPVLLISGYDDPAGLAGLQPDPARAFLQKPFTLDRLRTAVRGLLPTAAG